VIPLLRLDRQMAALAPDLEPRVAAILASGMFVQGKECEGFEAEFGAYLGGAHVAALGNGTTALELGLEALGIGRGDEVIVQANTFIATAAAVVRLGGTVRFVDCDPSTLQIDADAAIAAIGPKTRAVIVAHLFGGVGEVDRIVAAARPRGVFVVEDAAQAHGSRLDGKMAGTFGDLATYSFYPGKNLGAIGEAGAVASGDAQLIEKVAMLRNHGGIHKYEHQVVGTNGRMDELQAAALRVKLPHLEDWNRRRREIAAAYDRAFAAVPGIAPMAVPDRVVHTYHQYVVTVDDRDALQRLCAERGVGCGIHYPLAVPDTPAFQGTASGQWPQATRLAGHTLSLPMFPEMTDDEVKHVADVVCEGVAAVHAS